MSEGGEPDASGAGRRRSLGVSVQLVEEREPAGLADEAGVEAAVVDAYERAHAELDKQLLDELERRVELDRQRGLGRRRGEGCAASVRWKREGVRRRGRRRALSM